MHFFTYLIFLPVIITTTRPETCIWVPKGYFPSCGYQQHHINQEWELKKGSYMSSRAPTQPFLSWNRVYFSRQACDGIHLRPDYESGENKFCYFRKEIPCTMFRARSKEGSWKRKLWNTIWMWEKKCWIWIINSSTVEKCLLLKIWLVKNFWVL